MSGRKESSKTALAVGTTACVLVLGITLAVFPTLLNPGLPIFLGGLLAVGVGLCRALWGAGPYYRREGELVMALLLWSSICSFFTLDQYLTQKSLGSLVGAVAFFGVVPLALKSRRQWRTMSYSLVAVCTLASIQAWIPAVISARTSGTLQPLTGTFVNPDTFSLLPLVGLCLSMGLIERASPKMTAVNLGLCAFLLGTVFATGCRASMLGFVLGGAVFIGSLLRFRGKDTKKTQLFIGFPLLLTVFGLPILGYRFAFSSKWTRILETNAVEMEAIRFEIFKYGWKAILNNPFLGSGPGTFGLSYQSVRPANHNFMYIDIAHNDFLEMGVQCGILGLLLWVAITWFAIKTPIQYVRKGKRPAEAAAVTAAVVALATYSLFNFILTQRPVLWTQFWLLGLAIHFPSSRIKAQELPVFRYLGAGLLVVMGLWASFIGVQEVRANAVILEASALEAGLQFERATESYSKAEELDPARIFIKLKIVDLLEKARVFNGDDNLQRQLDILETSRKLSPRNIPVLLKQAEVQQNANRLDEATKTLEFAREITPYKREVFEAQLALLLRKGDLEAAADSLSDWTYDRWGESHKQFTKVLYSLALIEPSAGERIANEWLSEHPDERGARLIEDTISLANSNQRWQTSLRLQKCLKQVQPNNLCLDLEIGQTLGHLNGPSSEYEYLQQRRIAGSDPTDRCLDQLLARWSIVALDLGKSEEVQKALRAHLAISPDRSWARVRLAELLLADERTNDAIALLRKGLESKPNDPQLVFALAQAYEIQGSLETALSYYREASRLDPTNRTVQAKITQLVKEI